MNSYGVRIFLSAVLIIAVARNIPLAAQSSDLKADVTGSSGEELQKDVLRYTGLFGMYPITFLIGVKAWDWGSNHAFKSEREHWFGQDTSLGGADKAGHAMTFYMVQRITYSIFDYTENGRPRKWLYSMLTTFTMGFLIEVGDGWSSTYGFSYEDLIIDTCGLLFGAILDYFPVMDAFLGMSFEYIPTEGFRNHKKSVLDFGNDYSGWRYMVNLKMAGINYLWQGAPEFLRYVQFDLGYFTRGYAPHYDKGIKEYNNHTRDWFAGISVNFAEVAGDFFSDKKSTGYRLSRKPFEYYHIPAGYRHDEVIR